MNLSKTKYCKGQQCPKMLWMDQYHPEEYDENVSDESRFEIGNEVGDLAMSYFGEFTEVPYSKNLNEMVVTTQALLAAKTPVIAEATFIYEGDVCLVDILRLTEKGYQLIEVKSSTNSATYGLKKIKPTYFDDMSYQVYILKKCGIEINEVFLMQLNSDYVFYDKLDLQKLFILTDCTQTVMLKQKFLPENIALIKATVAESAEPPAIIGSNCDDPYTCGYKQWCFKGLPSDNVFTIGWRLRGDKKDQLYQSGIVSFRDVIFNDIPLTGKQRNQVLATLHNLPPQVDTEALNVFLAALRYPMYFLDFETYQQVIPQYNGVRPYSQIPFQYSLHIQEEKLGPLSHKEFLGESGKDPRRLLAEKLCADIPVDSYVVAYNSSFEKARLNDLAALFPDLRTHLLNIVEHLYDLAHPFEYGIVYYREMKGSYSIKTVLPALCPDDPQLDYHNLDLIHNGDEAMKAYATLHLQSPQEIAEIRRALLAYCRLDTLAMVKILEKLYQLS